MYSRRLFLCLLFLLALLAGRESHAAFELITHDVQVDLAARETTFTLNFSQPPDFFTLDEAQREANAFQYWYDSEPGGDPFLAEDVVVIRGSEVRFDDDLPIRDSLGEAPSPSGGWGPVRGAVPFDLNDTMLSFVVPWELLGESDELFSYEVSTFEFGATTSSAQFPAVPIPLPAGIWGGLMLLSGLGVMNIVQRLRSSSQEKRPT